MRILSGCYAIVSYLRYVTIPLIRGTKEELLEQVIKTTVTAHTYNVKFDAGFCSPSRINSFTRVCSRVLDRCVGDQKSSTMIFHSEVRVGGNVQLYAVLVTENRGGQQS